MVSQLLEWVLRFDTCFIHRLGSSPSCGIVGCCDLVGLMRLVSSRSHLGVGAALRKTFYVFTPWMRWSNFLGK